MPALTLMLTDGFKLKKLILRPEFIEIKWDLDEHPQSLHLAPHLC